MFQFCSWNLTLVSGNPKHGAHACRAGLPRPVTANDVFFPRPHATLGKLFGCAIDWIPSLTYSNFNIKKIDPRPWKYFDSTRYDVSQGHKWNEALCLLPGPMAFVDLRRIHIDPTRGRDGNVSSWQRWVLRMLRRVKKKSCQFVLDRHPMTVVGRCSANLKCCTAKI